MTYLDWGCDPLREECESCLDALCNACSEEFKRSGTREYPGDTGGDCRDAPEPDCDRCELEKKPDCRNCGIILGVCRDCSRNAHCEFRITG